MRSITFYKPSGEIVANCQCHENVLQATIDANPYDFVDGEYLSDQFYIDDKQPVMFPEKPDNNYVWNWELKQWELDVEQAAFDAVKKRNALLQNTDWTQLPDAPTDKNAWAVYRQHLRDITDQPDFPIKIDWGTPPSEE